MADFVHVAYNFCPNDGYKYLKFEKKCPLCSFDRTKAEEGANDDESPQQPWKKLLWVKQDYPDNYVDVSFLEELQRNVNVRAYDYWPLVSESGIISQHISSIVIFIALFIYMYSNQLRPEAVVVIGGGITIFGYGFWDLSLQKRDPNFTFERKKTFKGAILFFLTLLALSPILKTLTKATTSDTIWALTACLFVANTLFHDYSSGNWSNIKYPGSLSTNAAVFASVVLASRLPSNLHVFSLMLFAVEWFALFPIWRRWIKSISPRLNVTLTCSLVLMAFCLMIPISRAIAILYLHAMAFLTFICPFWLIWIQKYKNEIHGPWDEARPKLLQESTSE